MSDVAPPSSTPRSPTDILIWVATRVVVPLALIGAALACAGFMVSMRPSAERTAPTPNVPAVAVRSLEAKTLPATIQSSGVVAPARQVRLTAEVQGKIVSQSDKLVPGGRFSKGETLAQIDTRNYRSAVAAQERAVHQAELELALERNRGEVAAREWKLLGDAQKQDVDLALRRPHLKTAESAFEAAVAARDQAKANLGRTRLTAPFNAVVVEENVDVGQLVGPTAPVATLVGTDALWVQVSLPVERLAGIEIPGVTGELGSPVEVVQSLGERNILRSGRVIQLGGQLDPQTRTAQLLVEIPDPFSGEDLPLLPGAWVDVQIDGRALENTWEVPRSAIEQGRFAWVVDPEDKLRKRTLEIGWRNADSVIVTDGIEEGDRLVVSPLTLPVEGQPVQPIQEPG